jgi:hypothetical protein
LFEVNQTVASGLQPSMDFNDSLTHFVPKGESDHDPVEVVRDATETRPLGCKNTDNKTICGVWNATCRRALSVSACRLQRGFVPGRQSIHNVLNLDTAARIAGSKGHCFFSNVQDLESCASDGGAPVGTMGKPEQKSPLRREYSSNLTSTGAQECLDGEAKHGRGARIAASQFLCPLIALWDFASAFPSLYHSWLFIVLEQIGAPSGFYQMVKAM